MNCECIAGLALKYFFECNQFAAERRVLFAAAERRVLFAAAEHLLGSSWLNSPPLTRLHWFLYGHPDVSLSINIKLFSLVQDYININSKRFC